jgi:hypothetical protein
MSISVVCPKCSNKLKAGDSLAGRTVKCPKCAERFAVPAAHFAGGDGPLASVKATPRSSATVREPKPFQNSDREEDDDREGGADVRPQRPVERQEPAKSSMVSHSLGIAALVLGIVSLVISFIPCVGVIGIPLSVLGLLMSAIGSVIAITRKGSGIGFPIAGGAINLLAFGGRWRLVGVYVDGCVGRSQATCQQSAGGIYSQAGRRNRRQDHWRDAPTGD